MLNTEQISFLNEILKTNSPSGCEWQLVSLLKEYMVEYCLMETDAIGNLYMWASQKKEGLTVMITAHADEVGFQVTDISKEGLVYFRSVAGVDQQTIPGSKIVVLAKKGKIRGVVGKKSPHTQESKEREKVLNNDEMWIDLGFESDEEAKSFLECGDYITFDATPQILSNGNRITSKALDNKLGVFILVEVIKQLRKKELPISVVGVVTVQEELGCRGSIIAANRIKPDIAFCIDVGVATDIPNMSSRKFGTFELGKGVGIIRNADNNDILTHILIDAAKKNKIPFQRSLGYRATGGTEAAYLQLAQNGAIVANISIPNRYMHSAVEICDLRDAESAIMLLVKAIEVLNNY